MQPDENIALCPVGIELLGFLVRANLLWLVLHLLTPQLPQKTGKRTYRNDVFKAADAVHHLGCALLRAQRGLVRSSPV